MMPLCCAPGPVRALGRLERRRRPLVDECCTPRRPAAATASRRGRPPSAVAGPLSFERRTRQHVRVEVEVRRQGVPARYFSPRRVSRAHLDLGVHPAAPWSAIGVRSTAPPRRNGRLRSADLRRTARPQCSVSDSPRPARSRPPCGAGTPWCSRPSPERPKPSNADEACRVLDLSRGATGIKSVSRRLRPL